MNRITDMNGIVRRLCINALSAEMWQNMNCMLQEKILAESEFKVGTLTNIDISFSEIVDKIV